MSGGSSFLLYGTPHSNMEPYMDPKKCGITLMLQLLEIRMCLVKGKQLSQVNIDLKPNEISYKWRLRHDEGVHYEIKPN